MGYYDKTDIGKLNEEVYQIKEKNLRNKNIKVFSKTIISIFFVFLILFILTLMLDSNNYLLQAISLSLLFGILPPCFISLIYHLFKEQEI